MNFEELISGPCALPDAPLPMPKQELERRLSRNNGLSGILRTIFRQPGSRWAKADF